jgi:glycine betaine/proline transport system ATP-binding protein
VLVKAGDKMIDVVTCDAATLRHVRQGSVAMVFQQFGLLPWRTVAENVGFGLELAGVPEAERKTMVDKQLKLVGLTQWAGKFAHELSGGMQQRVGLARALAADSSILLMDEPFSALDPLIRRQLQDEFLALSRSMNKTVVFITHDLDEAIRIGDRIAIMKDGVIVQVGIPEEIVAAPAHEYVARFVADISRLNVVTARRIMMPVASYLARGGVQLDTTQLVQVSEHDPLALVVKRAARSPDPLAVTDGGGNIVGIIDRQLLLEGLSKGREP